MEVKMKISKKTFKGDDGKEVEYFAYEVELGGEVISFFPRKEDKRLVSHILSGYDLTVETSAK